MSREKDHTKPDFICIGPERTGTSWLYEVLKRHPCVWLPPIKEIRFLNEGNHIPVHDPTSFLFSKHWQYRSIRSDSIRLIRRLRKPNGLRQMRWFFEYIVRKHSFEWYSDLFSEASHLICGDLSPLYYGIPEAKIAELKKHKSDTRIIVIVRNPVDRVWSLALMHLCQREKSALSDVSDSEFVAKFDSIYETWTPYLETISLWKKHFTDVFVGSFDELNNEPEVFFSKICKFLAIDPSEINPTVFRKVNRGIGQSPRPKLLRHLKSQYHDEILELRSASHGRSAESWL